MKKGSCLTLAGLLVFAVTTRSTGAILGQHHFSWWDDPQVGVLVTPLGGPPPTQNSIQLFDLDEWHLDQAQTTTWYNGLPVAGLPVNPFNAANRNGLLGVIAAVNNAEAFIYQITNVNYFNGNGAPPFQNVPFSFTSPAPPGPGTNDLSGINIIDSGGALGISGVAPGSQFMFSKNLVVGSVLDMTPGSAGVANSQDWDFNAFTGPGNFEWDIDGEGIGASIAIGPIVFGYAMPGNWLDGINMGHVHSWSAGPPYFQVNITGPHAGFSGPVIPEPTSGTLVVAAIFGGTLFYSLRRRATLT